MIELLQVPSEFDPVVQIYEQRKPERVLEIGSWQGGTLRAWLQSGSPQYVLAVDLRHQHPENYQEWRKAETRLDVLTGNSQDDKIKEVIRANRPYDWLFIDGDHALGAARSDVVLARECAAPNAVLVLHDTYWGNDEPGITQGPKVLLEELRSEGLKVEEFVELPYEGPWGHGLGVVYL